MCRSPPYLNPLNNSIYVKMKQQHVFFTLLSFNVGSPFIVEDFLASTGRLLALVGIDIFCKKIKLSGMSHDKQHFDEMS